ncbi:MAG: hypothetical protein WAO98_08895 [Alphaproteobacteria bacterium]
MTRLDYQVLFAAFGFTLVAMQGERIPKKDGALRAAAFSQLIEEFCRNSVPEAFEDNTDSIVNRMADAIARIHKETGQCQPHELRDEFAQDEITRYWPRAFALAMVQLDIKFGDS